MRKLLTTLVALLAFAAVLQPAPAEARHGQYNNYYDAWYDHFRAQGHSSWTSACVAGYVATYYETYNVWGAEHAIALDGIDCDRAISDVAQYRMIDFKHHVYINRSKFTAKHGTAYSSRRIGMQYVWGHELQGHGWAAEKCGHLSCSYSNRSGYPPAHECLADYLAYILPGTPEHWIASYSPYYHSCMRGYGPDNASPHNWFFASWY